MSKKNLTAAVIFITLFSVSFSAQAQRRGVKQFRESYPVRPDKVLRVDIEIDAGEVRLQKSPRAREARATNGGIGEMRVDFRGALPSQAVAEIDLDIGETTLYLPEEAGITLSVSKLLFLSDVNLPHQFRKSGRYYYSRNYDEASNRLALHVSPGLGELRIDY